ncbi:hypothetical protein BGZ83_000334 [Gryganskiella cystojenkinii]|nr:hypothetical protein BGZ83_000334 [Gryganskiella cystojenkinii]
MPPVRGVTLECSDGSSYSGHLLICNVGDALQEKLASLEFDLDSDLRSNTSGSVAVASESSRTREMQHYLCGTTERLDPQRYPLMKEDTTQLGLVLDDRSGLTWWAATLVDHRIAWQVTKRVRLSEKSPLPPKFKSTQDTQAIRSMRNHVSPRMVCPIGGNMLQLVDSTLEENMSCKRWERGLESPVPVSVPSRVLFLGEGPGQQAMPIRGIELHT